MRLHAGGLWRHHDFLKLWMGQTLSELGSQITLLALPLTAVLMLRATPGQMGLLGAVELAPYVLVGLFAGVWVDRLRRRPILIGADLGRAVLLGSIPGAAALGWLTMAQLYSVGFLVGTLAVFSDLADSAFLLAVVGHERLIEAGSKQELSSSAVGIVGPGLAGTLVQLVTAPLAIALDTLSYLASAACMSLIRTPEAAPPPHHQRQKMWVEIREGLHTVMGHPLLRPMALAGSILGFFGNITEALWLLFAVHQLHLQPVVLGMLDALRSGGFLLGAWLTPWAVRRFGAGPSMLGGVVLMGAAWLPLPLLGGAPLIVLSLLVVEHIVSGLGNPLYNINASTMRQTITPDRLLGRMNATYRFIGRGPRPLGSLCGGVLGTLIGLRPTLAVGVLGFMLGALVLLVSPLPRLRELPRAGEELPSGY